MKTLFHAKQAKAKESQKKTPCSNQGKRASGEESKMRKTTMLKKDKFMQ